MEFRTLVANAGAIAAAALLLGGPLAGARDPQPPDAREQAAALAPEATPAAGSAPAAAKGAGAAAGAPDPHSGEALLEAYLGPRMPRTVQTYVVVLPDPLDSRLDWGFDAVNEAVRRAFERRQFVLDRFWLPWSLDADRARRDKAGEAGPGLRATHPGVVVFRRNTGGRDGTTVAVAWIVGESPMAGVHREALARALADRDRVLARWAPDSGRVLRVVGPIFSGSVGSLGRQLAGWAQGDPARRVEVVSGGATRGSNKRIVLGFDSTRRVIFHATVNPVDSLRAVLRDALTTRFGIPPEQIANLVESSTAYGNSARLSLDTLTRDRAIADSADRLPLELPFPLSISRLRAEYARNPAGGEAPVALPGSPPRSRIPLELDDPASALENFPSLSDLTAPAIERTLDDIAQTLLAHRIRAVVIIATDVRDRLFLADEVKRRLRDVKVALVGSHSLYSRPEVNESLRGALVVSTYPLFLESQYWDPTQVRHRTRQVFTSDLAEGTYNAMLLQLGDSADLADYAAPGGGGTVLRPPVWLTLVGRTSMVAVRARPLAWRDAAPGDTLGPCAPGAASRTDPDTYVAARCDSVTRNNVRIAALRGERVEPRALGFGFDDWALSALVLAAFGGLAAVLRRPIDLARGSPTEGVWHAFTDTFTGQHPVYARPSTPPAPAVAVPARPRTPGVAVQAQQDADDWARHGRLLEVWGHGWGVVRAVALTGAFAAPALVVLRPQVHATAASPLLAWALFAFLAVGFLVLPATDLRAALAKGRHDVDAHRPGLVVLAGTALFAALVTALVARVALLPPGDAAPFLSRALHLFSGVTPLVPLTIGSALLALWAHWHRRRTRMLGEAHAWEASPRAAGPAEADDPDARSVLTGLALGQRARWTLGALALLAAWVLVQLERTPEVLVLGPLLGASRPGPSAFDLLHRLLLAALLGVLAWGLLWINATWNTLRLQLRRLSDATWVGAIERLPAQVTRLTRLTPIGAPSAAWVDHALDAAAKARWVRMKEADLERTIAILRGAEQARGEADIARVQGSPRSLAAPALHTRALGDVAGLGRALDETLARLHPAETRLAPAAWTEAAEEFVALHAVDWVEWVVRLLREMALFQLAALILGTLLLSSYPFEPQTLVKALFFLLFAGTVGTLLLVLVQMNRDEVLSRITHTQGGKVTWDAPFLSNLLVLGVVPALTVIGSQFPEVRDFIFSWVSPLLKALGRG